MQCRMSFYSQSIFRIPFYVRNKMMSCAFIIYFISFIAGNQAHYWCTKTQEERQQAVCEQYAKAFDSEEALHPYHYIDKNWPAEKYSGGCYVSFMPCGVMTNFGKALRAPIGRVYFAGSEAATLCVGKKVIDCSIN